MNEGYELLVEKDVMWAEMLEQVLKDNGISCASIPVYGAGLTLRAGVKERMKIYVPSECVPQAKELLVELFPENESV
ncbi:MAG: hypothetical protein IJL71_04660 [Oscillospiraceae bacterium]|nr:hypothetical protein [Oscillospiraceae bacterium]